MNYAIRAEDLVKVYGDGQAVAGVNLRVCRGEVFGLTDAAGRQVRGYSGGMRRRLDIVPSMIARPELLFLNKPTTGLDPRARRCLRHRAAAGGRPGLRGSHHWWRQRALRR